MTLRSSLDRIYYEIAKNELRSMHEEFTGKITYNTLLYLKLIGVNQFCTITSIAQDVHVAKSAVTIKVREMEKQGLVYKVQSNDDKRIFYLRLTPVAVSFYRNYDSSLSKAIQTAQEIFSPEDIANFEKVLQFFINFYSKHRFPDKIEDPTIDNR